MVEPSEPEESKTNTKSVGPGVQSKLKVDSGIVVVVVVATVVVVVVVVVEVEIIDVATILELVGTAAVVEGVEDAKVRVVVVVGVDVLDPDEDDDIVENETHVPEKHEPNSSPATPQASPLGKKVLKQLFM